MRGLRNVCGGEYEAIFASPIALASGTTPITALNFADVSVQNVN
ncbi:MAG TPA: hypothetical protein VLI90_13370 [Tepidisphaeraceae bacterium]|nr:hypothetical protein [Tepidisphaeraceae bacterium]